MRNTVNAYTIVIEYDTGPVIRWTATNGVLQSEIYETRLGRTQWRKVARTVHPSQDIAIELAQAQVQFGADVTECYAASS
jgi:hypothetical protein